ncbi:MAG: polymer-forming cytoskeletal protein [Deltaproteobacteria bacterium]|nr:polymer-forming cytoskeletal protein [Deltaproteobacteria bacterium]
MKRKRNGESSKLDTLIGPNTTLEGSIKTKGSLTVEGRIRGEVEAKGEIVVGGTGKIEADILADSVMVGGEIVGEIIARRRLEITETGRVTGDVKAASITVKEGGKVDGSFRMKVDDSFRVIGETAELDLIPFEAEKASSSS